MHRTISPQRTTSFFYLPKEELTLRLRIVLASLITIAIVFGGFHSSSALDRNFVPEFVIVEWSPIASRSWLEQNPGSYDDLGTLSLTWHESKNSQVRTEDTYSIRACTAGACVITTTKVLEIYGTNNPRMTAAPSSVASDSSWWTEMQQIRAIATIPKQLTATVSQLK